jgi:hypothetical protein
MTSSRTAHLSVEDFDAAFMAHMAHGAMAGNDPLTDSLFGQLEAAAAEGAMPAAPYAAGLTEQQRVELAEAQSDPWLYWVLPAGVAVALALSHVWPLGLAG